MKAQLACCCVGSGLLIGCNPTVGANKETLEEVQRWRNGFQDLRNTLPDVADKVDLLAIKEIFRAYQDISALNEELKRRLGEADASKVKGNVATVEISCWQHAGKASASIAMERIKLTDGKPEVLESRTIASMACPSDRTRPLVKIVPMPVELHGPGDYRVVVKLDMMNPPQSDWQASFKVDFVDRATGVSGNVCTYEAYEQGWTPNMPPLPECLFSLRYYRPAKPPS